MFVQPTVTDEDIAWACRVMGLPLTAFSGAAGTDPRFGVLKRMDTVDVEACPGSGKTTLLVAKLAILARRWPSSRAGMCVLSHTNAARDEIANRLSSCTEGTVLMGYPHFVGTIHAFANEFLALPYLRSKGNPIRIIDSDVALERRWSKVPYKTKIYLDRQNNGNGRGFLRYDQDDYVGKKMSRFKPHTETYKRLQEICKASSEEGYFCYDELFVWARKILAERPEVAHDLRRRFPLVFIDEVQDNDEEQSSLLHQVFLQGGNPSLRQRFGDSNQAIYRSSGITSGAVTDPFPGPVRVDLPNSFRFGALIAGLADPFGVAPQGLVGIGPDQRVASAKERAPAIFLFGNASVQSVLPEYGAYLTELFSPEELQSGIFTAVAGVHKSDSHDKVPRWMGHYVPTYNPQITRRDPVPDFFSQYVAVGWREAQQVGRSEPIVRASAQAMLELLRRAGLETTGRGNSNPHLNILALLKNDSELRGYLRIIDLFVTRAGTITADQWNKNVSKAISVIGGNILGVNITAPDALAFLNWEVAADKAAETSVTASGNVFNYPAESPQLSIRLGSIHSVKGETHCSTLVLDTYFHDHHLSALKPWLLGKKSGGAGLGSRMLGRLRLHYVGMTRPSHLLCLAMRGDTLTAEDRKILQKRGWALRECPASVDAP
jgi:hypothetical protein